MALQTYPPAEWRHLGVPASDYRAWLTSALANEPSIVAWYDAALGVTSASERVSEWANQLGSAGSLLQGTGANQPILLPDIGESYLALFGSGGNDATAPDSVPLSITGDIDIRVDATLADWEAINTFVTKDAGGVNRSWNFLNSTAAPGKLSFYNFTDGTTAKLATSSVVTGFAAGTRNKVRVTLATASGEVKFYTWDGLAWVQLGTTQTIAAGAIFDSTAVLQIGVRIGDWPTTGKIHRIEVYSGIEGTLVFDANFSALPEGATSFT